MDLVPEHHPSSALEGVRGPTDPTPPPQPQLPKAADTHPDSTCQPQTNQNHAEESTSSNALNSAPEMATEALMDPGQPGTQNSSLALPLAPPRRVGPPTER